MSSTLPTDSQGTRVDVPIASLSVWKKLLLLAGNAIPFLLCIGLGVTAWALWVRPLVAMAVVAGGLYLVPPVLSRMVGAFMPIRRHEIAIGSREFFSWWFSLNLQMVFCRFAFFEEFLRIVPGLYSMWLRLWGARIGRLTYWAAGVQILDRKWVEIGHNVTFGAGVKINPHVILKEGGRTVLVLAPVKIGDRASIGGYSLLVAGTRIGADESPRAFTILPPFSRIEGGRRIKGDEETGEE